MKRILGDLRRADQDFGLIQSGDRVAVGVSGGKDSLVLLEALALYRKFSPHPFELGAITVSMGLEPFDLSGVAALCEELDVPYHVEKTQIGRIVFEERKEPNPCALCAKMRRGALYDAAVAQGANKVALGHHRDDVIETLLLSLVFEARLHTFHPNTYLSRTGITAIRPMVYLPEKHVIHMARELALPVVHNPCPADGNTKRQEMKDLLATLSHTYPHLKEYMLKALQNREQYGLWDKRIVGKPEEA